MMICKYILLAYIHTHMYIHIHIHIHIYLHIYICIHTYMHAKIQRIIKNSTVVIAQEHACMYAYIDYTHIHTRNIQKDVDTYTHAYLCMCRHSRTLGTNRRGCGSCKVWAFKVAIRQSRISYQISWNHLESKTGSLGTT
jgi:hypothetical protein